PSAVRDRSESVDTAGRSGKTSCIAPGTGTPCCKSARSGRKRFQSRTHPGAIPRRSQASDFGALRPEFPYGFKNSCRLTKLLVRNFDVEVSAQKKVFHCMHNPVHANLYFRALLDFVRDAVISMVAINEKHVKGLGYVSDSGGDFFRVGIATN